MFVLDNVDCIETDPVFKNGIWYSLSLFMIMHTILFTQVHDFYLSIKFNKFSIGIKALYRLFIACCMLHNVKIPGSKRQGHNYPKIQLAHLLIMQYWNKYDSCATRMMSDNMGIYNEEFGEITFSMLARCTVGDTIKDDFDYMNKMYTLLPILRDLKDDILDDSNTSEKLSWRHVIDEHGDEVATCTIFFKRSIRQICNGTFKVYNSSGYVYKNSIDAILDVQTSSLPLVWMDSDNIESYINDLYGKIYKDVSTFFLHQYIDVWPDAHVPVSHDEHEEHDVTADELSSIDDEQSGIDDDESNMLQCSSNDINRTDNSCQDSCDFSNDDSFDISESPYLNRSWDAWGTINNENRMFGKRSRIVPQRYSPSSPQNNKRHHN